MPDLIINTLSALSVKYIFHLPGTPLKSMYDSLSRQKQIKSVLFKHEQAACFAAAGYALVTNQPGICMVMNGPGVTNTISAVSECYFQSIPLVIITADNPQKDLGIESFHEVDTFTMLRPVTKKIIIPHNAKEIQQAVVEALSTATEGRPGPVYLNIPMSLMTKTASLKKIRIKKKDFKATAAEAAKALHYIESSRDPVIFAGSGIKRGNAEKELAEFVSLTGIPVFTSLGGRGAFPEGSHLSLGMMPFNFDPHFLSMSDLCIVLGARLNPVNLRMGRLKLPEKIVRVDIDNENPRNRIADFFIRSDIRMFLRVLNQKIKKSKSFSKHSESSIYKIYRKEYDTFASAEYENELKKTKELTTKKFLLELAAFLDKRQATIFSDSIWIPFSHFLPKAKRAKSFFSMNNFGCLGFALPSAIGAAFAEKRKKTISLSGDGAFLFNCQELSTAATYGLKNFIQIIFNNDGYSIIYNSARRMYKRQHEYYSWNSIDYSGFARSLGVKAITVDSANKINGALQQAFTGKGPFVINVIARDESS